MLPKPWYRASKKAWYLQVSRNEQICLGRTKEESRVRFRQWLLDQGSSLSKEEQSSLTIAELAQDFLDHCKLHTKPRSYAFYCYFVVPFVERFGAAAAATFAPRSFEKWLDEHKGWKGARRNAIVVVGRLFNWAVKAKLLKENPVAGVAKPMKRKRKRILSAEERSLLLSTIRDRYFREYCIALLETGARPMEVASVTANHVSRDGTLWIFDEHKADRTGDPRLVYLTPAMQELTKKLMDEFPDGPLFRSTRRKHGVRSPWTKNGIRCRFRALRKKHAELHGVTAYVLRHTFTTYALINGVPVPLVSALLGHRSIRMVDEHYNHTEQVSGKLHEAAKRATACA